MIHNTLVGGGILSHRRRFMTQRVERPYDAKVEYLEVNTEGGVARIDTEYIPSVGHEEVQLKFMPLSLQEGSTGWWFGPSQGGYVSSFYIKQASESLAIMMFFNRSVSENIGFNQAIVMGTKYEVIMEGDGSANSKASITVNGKKNNMNNIVGNAPTNSIKIFGSTAGFEGRIYSFKWFRDSVPMLDLIPVRKGGVGYMYDRISGRLFGNAYEADGSRFILGPDII